MVEKNDSINNYSSKIAQDAYLYLHQHKNDLSYSGIHQSNILKMKDINDKWLELIDNQSIEQTMFDLSEVAFEITPNPTASIFQQPN